MAREKYEHTTLHVHLEGKRQVKVGGQVARNAAAIHLINENKLNLASHFYKNLN